MKKIIILYSIFVCNLLFATDQLSDYQQFVIRNLTNKDILLYFTKNKNIDYTLKAKSSVKVVRKSQMYWIWKHLKESNVVLKLGKTENYIEINITKVNQ